MTSIDESRLPERIYLAKSDVENLAHSSDGLSECSVELEWSGSYDEVEYVRADVYLKLQNLHRRYVSQMSAAMELLRRRIVELERPSDAIHRSSDSADDAGEAVTEAGDHDGSGSGET